MYDKIRFAPNKKMLFFLSGFKKITKEVFLRPYYKNN